MDKIISVFTKYWYLLVSSLALSIPGLFGMMIGVWIIGMLTQSIFLGLIASAFILTLIVTLPIGIMCIQSKEILGKSTAIILWISIVLIFFLIFIGIGSMIVIK